MLLDAIAASFVPGTGCLAALEGAGIRVKCSAKEPNRTRFFTSSAGSGPIGNDLPDSTAGSGRESSRTRMSASAQCCSMTFFVNTTRTGEYVDRSPRKKGCLPLSNLSLTAWPWQLQRRPERRASYIVLEWSWKALKSGVARLRLVDSRARDFPVNCDRFSL